ncbi:formate dehydrogenase accessory sulfurtransferase FdhD [Salinisphaera sp. Q1T1-3]|uniref:formate dehydrogenase accessory sulfurtransferase FdhD n=1 Tax=Salinisphaera sp. Q1T1-3 TaxID=2321229 RepID=UPI000E72FD56|nr:formate dehydrogenase accessory sulfurtransferase FdhD [Salinisphaera sp. Q1T1-3]RJS91997.1 formate dehydrogenase accessory sulfurtransferase FdhD [Salinisphaera sp. Q1T1-3]
MSEPDVTPPPSAADAADAPRRTVAIQVYRDGSFHAADDTLAVERALEIHIAGAAPLITMRTPGDDTALAAGLLHAEGVVQTGDDIVYLKHAPESGDVVRVMLRPAARERLGRMARSTVATSACGVCGKPSFTPITPDESWSSASQAAPLEPATLLSLPPTLQRAQRVFASTGGLHAAGLFDSTGTLLDVAEDIGRHNALDKLVGRALRADALPLSDRILLLSSRASYELLQKSVMAGIPIVCAVSAPSTHAVDLAREFDVTLVGFLRDARFNIYAGAHRIATSL